MGGFFVAWMRVDDLKIVAGDRVLLQGATFRLDPGVRVGLVGPNGMGKTSLFRVLAGDALPDDGQIQRSDDLRIATLNQLHTEGLATVYQTAWHSSLVLPACQSRMHTLEDCMADPARASELDDILTEYAGLQEVFQQLGGYEWDARVYQALLGAGITPNRFEDPPDLLSGGERHRLSLVQVVLSGANVWLLDEPTNHLDLDAMDWLEQTLLHFDGAVIMASHDRRFLERTATRIMSWEDGFFWITSGGYRQYVHLRAERQQHLRDQWQRYVEERQRLMAYVERYRAGSRATQAKSRLHAVARLDRDKLELPKAALSNPGKLSHAGQELGGTSALVVKDLILTVGDRQWEPVTFKLPAAGRLAVIGPNGAGKTTLLKALITSQSGVRWNPDARLAWYDQEAASLLPETTTGLALCYEEGMDRETAYHLGARFGLHADLLNTTLERWSGGERSRLALLFALMAPSSVLLLDEPTNHLDLPMREELEALLAGYPGALIVVSHDREFLDNTTTHTLWWHEGRFSFSAAPYSQLSNR